MRLEGYKWTIRAAIQEIPERPSEQTLGKKFGHSVEPKAYLNADLDVHRFAILLSRFEAPLLHRLDRLCVEPKT